MCTVIAIVIVILILLSMFSTVYSFDKWRPWYAYRWTPVLYLQRRWNVVGTYENHEEAAKLLARVNHTVIRFLRKLKEDYHIDETDDGCGHDSHLRAINSPNDLYNIVDHLLDNYNPDVFYENDPKTASDTSYTINKGDSMYICLRNRDRPNTLVDESTLLFTMLHEISHIANYRGWGHGKDFWACFKFIFHLAQLAGIYSPVDYSKYPTNFCGLNINYNPLFDDSVVNLWAP